MKPNAVAGSPWALWPFAALLWGASLAVLADQSVKVVDPQNVPWVTWLWVFGLSVGGWFASSAPSLVNWVEGEGVELLRKRLEVAKGFVCALLAGGVAYLVALGTGLPTLPAFLGVLFAAYGGDKYLSRMAAARPAGK